MLGRQEDITTAYVEMVHRRVAMGFSGTLLTMIFKELAGSEAAVAARMNRSAEKLYAMLLTRIIRNPRKTAMMDLPFWIVCPDWPVPKQDRHHFANVAPNNGRHLHAIAMLPPKNRLGMILEDHINENHDTYSSKIEDIWRIHAAVLTETPHIATRYGLKSVTRRRASEGDIVVFPRSHSEMSGQCYW